MKIYQLKIHLSPNYIKPPIWRRVLVKSDITFYELHQIIQVAMGWTNSHLWDFNFGDFSITMPSKDDDWRDVVDANSIKISKLLNKEKDKINYTYDYGDSWEHKITLEKIVVEDKKQIYPVCIKGKRACPPEDCGGSWGYESMLETISDKKHPEHEDMLEWIGGGFDSEEFEIDDVNDCLQDEGCWKGISSWF
ncbi:MAG TPA: plasmid pRiA4b ORF-3 family protein [Flavobacteriaceae bacterium]|nr:plasmid pRiA4b ORF-3 family protein [Flavobacteriaceae bacterium]